LAADHQESPEPSAESLRRAFDRAGAYTVGLEDEVMLLDPESHELVPRAQDVLARLRSSEVARPADPSRFKVELPASQLEIVVPPASGVKEACQLLLAGRTELTQRTVGLVQPAAVGVHPFSPGRGELNPQPPYEHTIREYGEVAERQLVCAFQVHVAPGDADRALAVYNGARSYLPLLAALAANAPFYEGRDTGLASVRPKLCELLPRQGVPPVIESWDQYARALGWGAAAGRFAPGAWWWELRPHWRFGTLEFRVPDGQSSLADAAAVAAVVQALVVWLGRRHDAGEPLDVAPSWAIAENRWAACRYGVEGQMADLKTGALGPTRSRLHELLDALEPVAGELGSAPLLQRARELVECNGAMRQRQVAAGGGMPALGRWLGERFLDPLPG
jgi:carboxylate-amine ligase